MTVGLAGWGARRQRFGGGDFHTAPDPFWPGTKWQAPDGAPERQALGVRVRQGDAEYELPFSCALIGGAWFNVWRRCPLAPGLTVTGWRRRDFAHRSEYR